MKQVAQDLKENNIYFQRFPAFDGGWKGCTQSHLTILEKSLSEVAFTIFEDDVMFIEDLDYVGEAIMQLPKDWDALYLGGSPQGPQERYSDNLFKVNNTKTSHAIIWHNRPNGAIEWILENKEHIGKWDRFLYEMVQPLFNCFMVCPMVCTQRETGTSDTCKRSDVSTIVDNYNKYCNGY